MLAPPQLHKVETHYPRGSKATFIVIVFTQAWNPDSCAVFSVDAAQRHFTKDDGETKGNTDDEDHNKKIIKQDVIEVNK